MTPTQDAAALAKTRSVSHDEAKQIALRLIRGAFRRDGERLPSDKRPNFSIPTRVNDDDDCLMIAYVEQQAAPKPDHGDAAALADRIKRHLRLTSLGLDTRALLEGALAALAAAPAEQPAPRAALEPIQDTWFTDRRLPILAMSGDTEDDQVLRLMFRHKVSDTDRARLVEVLNAGENALATAPAPVETIPQGWKLVPLIPTEQMIETGCDNNPTQWNEGTSLDFSADVANDVYVSMVKAAPPAPAEDDPLSKLVSRFAYRLLKKLRLAQANGRSGWERDDWEKECQQGLLNHVAKGDPRDVAAYCAFMDHHGWITVPAPAEDVRAAVIEQHIGWLKLYIEGMTVDNWRDIQLRAARKLDELSEEIDRALAHNRGEPSVVSRPSGDDL